MERIIRIVFFAGVFALAQGEQAEDSSILPGEYLSLLQTRAVVVPASLAVRASAAKTALPSAPIEGSSNASVPAKESESDLPLCTKEEMHEALQQMGPHCKKRVTDATTQNTLLSDEERCFCYLTVDVGTASSLQCRTTELKAKSMAEEYASCSVGAMDLAANSQGNNEKVNEELALVGGPWSMAKDVVRRLRYGKEKLDDKSGKENLDEESGKDMVDEKSGMEELDEKSGMEKVDEKSGKEELHEKSGIENVDEKSGKEELHEESGMEKVDEKSGKEELDDKSGMEKVDEKSGKEELDEKSGMEKVDEKSGKEVVAERLARLGLEHASSAAKAASKEGGVVRLLDFTQAELVVNNLGGQGPQTTLSTGEPAPNEIRYRNLVRDSDVDLVITAGEGYEAHNPSRNGILGGNGQINAKSGTTASLTFTFVDADTNTPRVMPKFYMTFSDVDERHGGNEKESISVDGYERYYTNDDLMLVADGAPIPTFQSADYGNFDDNAFSPDSPSPTQLSHAVTYLFLNKATFNADFTIDVRRGRASNGRNVLFSGISQLVFCRDPSTYLDFSTASVTTNNLGGQGPDTDAEHELRYSGIATSQDGQVLDLVATADETYGYEPWNSSQNGLHGEFGHINLFSGSSTAASEAYVTFTVVRSGTMEPVVLNQFAFVVFDFDAGISEQQMEYVDLKPTASGFEGGPGYASYIVTDTTEVDITNRANGKKRFKATKHGTEADNPTTAQNLAREVADKSVVFTFRQASSFTITLGITATGYNTGRNFMFSGQNMYLMCD